MKPRLPVISKPSKNLMIVAAAYCACHGSLFIFDLMHPSSFLAGDRALARLATFSALLSPKLSFFAVLAANPGVGDYIFQLPFYAVGGRLGLILFQIAFGAIASAFSYLLALRTLGSELQALIAALIFMLLPGSLLTPHILVSESICNPFLIIGITLCCLSFGNGCRTLPELCVAAFFLGCAAFVRPGFLLFLPIMLVIVVPNIAPSRRWVASGALLAAFLAMTGIGMGLSHVASPDLRGGPGADANRTIPHYMWQRARRMAVVGDFALPERDMRDRSIPASEFVRIVTSHPDVFAETMGADVLTLVVNPGANQLFAEYLGAFRTEASFGELGRMRDSEGVGRVFGRLASRDPAFAAVLVILTAAWVVVLSAGVIGMWAMSLRGRTPQWWLLASFTLYALAVPFLAGSVRWAHRTPTDFLLAIFAAAGISVALRSRHMRAVTPAASPA